MLENWDEFTLLFKMIKCFPTTESIALFNSRRLAGLKRALEFNCRCSFQKTEINDGTWRMRELVGEVRHRGM